MRPTGTSSFRRPRELRADGGGTRAFAPTPTSASRAVSDRPGRAPRNTQCLWRAPRKSASRSRRRKPRRTFLRIASRTWSRHTTGSAPSCDEGHEPRDPGSSVGEARQKASEEGAEGGRAVGGPGAREGACLRGDLGGGGRLGSVRVGIRVGIRVGAGRPRRRDRLAGRGRARPRRARGRART